MNLRAQERRKDLEADSRAQRARGRRRAIRQYWGILGLVSAAAGAGVLSVATAYLAYKSPWAFVTAIGLLVCLAVMARAFWILFVPPLDDAD
jgi:hypothetical protein